MPKICRPLNFAALGSCLLCLFGSYITLLIKSSTQSLDVIGLRYKTNKTKQQQQQQQRAKVYRSTKTVSRSCNTHSLDVQRRANNLITCTAAAVRQTCRIRRNKKLNARNRLSYCCRCSLPRPFPSVINRDFAHAVSFR